jgi:hypothetical protein
METSRCLAPKFITSNGMAITTLNGAKRLQFLLNRKQYAANGRPMLIRVMKAAFK